MIKPFFKQWMGKGEEFNIVDYTEEQTEKKEKDKKEDTAQMIIERREEEEEREQRRKDARRAISENWDDRSYIGASTKRLPVNNSISS